MDKLIKQAIAELINDNRIYIDKIVIDNNNFGNIEVVLKSNDQIDIRFIKDREEYWCEIGRNQKWYFIEDILFVINNNNVNIYSKDFIDMVTTSSILIKKNWSLIVNAFDNKNWKDTKNKIKIVATKRVMKILDY